MTGRAAILATGMYVPDEIVTNDHLASFVPGVTSEGIERICGIRERRRSSEDEAASDLAAHAATDALENVGMTIADMDFLIVGTATPDRVTPPTASLLLGKLGGEGIPSFDVNSGGCANSVFALIVASGLLKHRGAIGLVVAVENFKGRIDYSTRDTCPYFGDGAAAFVVGYADDGSGIVAHRWHTYADQAGTITVPGGGSETPVSSEMIENGLQYLKLDGRGVWDFASRAFPEAVRALLDDTGTDIGNIDLVVPHQANRRLIEYGVQELGLGLDRVAVNVERYGNTGGASVGIALHEAVQSGRLRRGDLVVLCGFGAGLAVGTVLVRW